MNRKTLVSAPGIVMASAVGLAVVAALFFIEKPEPAISAAIIPQQAYIPPAAVDSPESPVQFSDVTLSSGIDFKHYNGASVTDSGDPTRYMPETMGPGVAVLDFDNDGLLDIFIANSSDFDLSDSSPVGATAKLYRNLGDWLFEDVTEAAGLDIEGYGMGSTVADYDADGDPDILLTFWGGVSLMQNTGKGQFRDVSNEALPHRDNTSDAPDWSTGAVFFDADGDLDLDIFIADYVRWKPESDVFSTLDGKTKSYAVPTLYEGGSSRLLLQDKGVFRDATSESGMNDDQGKSLGVALWDFNEDGLMDLVVANDTQPNFLYINQGEGKFEDRALESGIAYDESGRTRAGMGIDVADIMNDGRPSIAIGNFSREPVSVFKEESKGFYREASQSMGVSEPSLLSLTFGLLFADFDLDGWQDLILANGHIEPDIQNTEAEVTYRQPMVLLGNSGASRFVNWSGSAGEFFSTPIVGRGVALGDLDLDGDLDLVVSENNGPIHLLRNELDLSERRYLRVKLRGQAPNADAIGAKLELTSSGGGVTQTRIVRGGSSYLSQSEFVQTFGLTKDDTVENLRVTWPDGSTVDYEVPELNSTLVLDEASNKLL